MKYIASSTLLIIALTGHAQLLNEESETYYYQMATDLLLFKYDICNDSIQISEKRVLGRYQQTFFRIGRKRKPDSLAAKMGIKDFYIIKSRNLGNETEEISSPCGAAWNYYIMEVKDFEDGLAIKSYHKWQPSLSVATVLIPIKIRPATRNQKNQAWIPGDFSVDYTLGTMAGLRWRIDKTDEDYFNLLGGVGITSVLADNSNTNDVISEQDIKMSATTISMGAVLEFEQIQIGVFWGKDWVGKSVHKNWDYYGKSWWAVGLGFQMISRNNKEAKSAKKSGD